MSWQKSTKTRTPIVTYDIGEEPKWTLWMADQHWDNPMCHRKMLTKHLDQARERNADIYMLGDFFCAMQGKDDPRHTKEAVREENMANNYYDSLVEDAVEYLKPYVEQITLIGYGNHETSVIKKKETDLIRRMVGLLNTGGGNICLGAYGGYVLFRFRSNEHRLGSVKAFYTHGFGGGGPVTKGSIAAQRRSAFIGDADIIFSGHIHESWIMESVQHRINSSGNEYLSPQLHVQVPTYKEEYKLGRAGWHVERGAPPKPLGAWWVKFSKAQPLDDSDFTHPVEIEIIRAQ